MKVNISRITETKMGNKSIEDIVFDIYMEKNNFLQYELENNKTNATKLVLKNLNHISMLHKHFMFEHFYVILFVVIVVGILSLFSNSYLMQLVAFAGVLYIPYKLIAISEVPYKLVIDGLKVSEINHIGKKIIEFNANIIESSNSEKYENDFIFITASKTSKNHRIMSLMIMEDFEFEIREFIRDYFDEFNFKNSVKARGQL